MLILVIFTNGVLEKVFYFLEHYYIVMRNYFKLCIEFVEVMLPTGVREWRVISPYMRLQSSQKEKPLCETCSVLVRKLSGSADESVLYSGLRQSCHNESRESLANASLRKFQ